MKLRWLTLLILGTHFSIFAPNALAVESKLSTESLPVVKATADDIVLVNDEWQPQPDDKWAGISDEDVSLEKGNRRRRRYHDRIRHRDLRHPRVRHPRRIRHPRRRIIRRSRLRHGGNVRRIIIINGGHGGLYYGEFRRDDIFFRNYPFRNDRFHRERFRRFRHDDFRHHHFDHDEFRLIIRSD